MFTPSISAIVYSILVLSTYYGYLEFHLQWGVRNQWNGMMEWNAGMEYWNGMGGIEQLQQVNLRLYFQSL